MGKTVVKTYFYPQSVHRFMGETGNPTNNTTCLGKICWYCLCGTCVPVKSNIPWLSKKLHMRVGEYEQVKVRILGWLLIPFHEKLIESLKNYEDSKILFQKEWAWLVPPCLPPAPPPQKSPHITAFLHYFALCLATVTACTFLRTCSLLAICNYAL